MPRPIASPDDLTALFEGLSLQPGGGQLSPEVAQAQFDQLLARVAELTGALRGAGSDGTTRLAARLLVADLGFVAAHLRGRTNDIGASLTRAIEGIQRGLSDTDLHPEDDTDRPRAR